MPKQDPKEVSVINDARGEIFTDRRLATFYINLVDRFDGLLTEAQANFSGNIERSGGKVSEGLESAGTVSNAIPVVGNLAQLFFHAASKIAGFFNKKDIAEKQENILDLVGDADREDWSKFVRELAVKLTLENSEEIKSKANLVDKVEPHRRASLKKDGRDAVLSAAKSCFNGVMKFINESKILETEAGINIGDKNFRGELISQIVEADQSKKDKGRSPQSVSEPHIHLDQGRFTHAVINHGESSAIHGH